MLDAFPFATIGCTVKNVQCILHETVKTGLKFLLRAAEFQPLVKVRSENWAQCYVVYFPMQHERTLSHSKEGKKRDHGNEVVPNPGGGVLDPCLGIGVPLRV